MQRIAVVDYHMGNLHSVSKALERVAQDSAEVVVTHAPETIGNADRVVFPGQGAARDCMAEIERLGLAEAVRNAALNRPFLGICMGLQVLLEHSEEADTPCLGIFEGKVRRLNVTPGSGPAEPRLSLPQMGWNRVRQKATPAHPLWAGIADGSHFYFANSYHVCPRDESIVAGTTHYGHEFVCAIASGGLFAVQFHPEKSQHAGLRLLANFVAWDGA